MKRPTLSIVVPTCDRPDTLVVCLRTLAKQPNDHVEIIIQDNACDARTIAIIEAAKAADPRIVHHRVEERLSLRNNFEDGVAAARGDYISIIGDDDAFCAGGIDRIVALLREHKPIAMRWQLATYYWPSLSDANLGYFHLHYTNFYGGWRWRDARPLMQRMMSGEMAGLWESLQIYHGAMSRELYEETKARTGGIFFQYHIPDVYVHTALLAVAGNRENRRYIDVEHPLSIYGLSGHSNGSSWYAGTSEKRGDQSPMAQWERAAASDKQVKMELQNPIRSMKYHDYAVLMLTQQLGLHDGTGIDHERWCQSIVDEVAGNPTQYRGFVEATPKLDYEKAVVGRVLRDLGHLETAAIPEPDRLKHVYPECWRWQQLCLVSAAPGKPDDVETAVDVLGDLVDIDAGTEPMSPKTGALAKRLRKALKLDLMELYLANPPDLTAQKGVPPVGARRAQEPRTGWGERQQADYTPEPTYLRVPGSRWVKKAARDGFGEAVQAGYVPPATYVRVPGSRWVKKTVRKVRGKLQE